MKKVAAVLVSIGRVVRSGLKDMLKVAVPVAGVLSLLAAVIPSVGLKSSLPATVIISTSLGVLNAFIQWANSQNLASKVVDRVRSKR